MAHAIYNHKVKIYQNQVYSINKDAYIVAKLLYSSPTSNNFKTVNEQTKFL